ncbi:hypothetical protein [Leptolyngbya sp. NIES-2104]|nr:hypothetical protein [Leptolyngbya sp. NIES-2104]GAP99178.1 hypothetical protein NIES2104_57370 [Leptolyngbya sp. NIES-2104]
MFAGFTIGFDGFFCVDRISTWAFLRLSIVLTGKTTRIAMVEGRDRD